MTREEKEENRARRQRDIESLRKSMREDSTPPDADELTKSWFMEILFCNAAGVTALEKE